MFLDIWAPPKQPHMSGKFQNCSACVKITKDVVAQQQWVKSKCEAFSTKHTKWQQLDIKKKKKVKEENYLRIFQQNHSMSTWNLMSIMFQQQRKKSRVLS